MAARGAFELVHAVEAPGGDGVELAGDAVAGAGEVEEEWDAVGAADEGESGSGAAGGDEDCVAGGGEVLDKGVIGEASF